MGLWVYLMSQNDKFHLVSCFYLAERFKSNTAKWEGSTIRKQNPQNMHEQKPNDIFESEEKGALAPLPTIRWELMTYAVAKVQES
jgi:hypothetical protein